MLLMVLYHKPVRIFRLTHLFPDKHEKFNFKTTHPTSQNNWTAWPCSSLQGNNIVGQTTGDHLISFVERTSSADLTMAKVISFLIYGSASVFPLCNLSNMNSGSFSHI